MLKQIPLPVFTVRTRTYKTSLVVVVVVVTKVFQRQTYDGAKEGDPIRWNGGMKERNGGIAEYMEYSKTRKINEYFETRNIRNILMRGMRGKSFKKGYK